MRIFTSKQKETGLKINFFALLIAFYIIILSTVSSMACFFSYEQKKEELMSKINNSYILLKQEYQNIVDNFWQVYMPVFELKTDVYDIWNTYFSDIVDVLSPLQKKELENSLRLMLLRDNDIKWIVLYNIDRSDNYILYNDGTSLQKLPENFPYIEELNFSSQTMEVYGMKNFEGEGSVQNTFAVCGNIPSRIDTGKLIVGYGIEKFQSICKNNISGIDELNYVICNNGDIVFDYRNSYHPEINLCIQDIYTGISRFSDGKNYHISTQTCGLNSSTISYYMPSLAVLKYCHQNTPLLMCITVLFMVLSIAAYLLMLHTINKEVSLISHGLKEIGKNNLDYKLPVKFSQSGLPEIALAINQMTLRLKDNINRAYYYELRQKEAELSELQSKFNPHFLYNTLEMLRSRCQLNNDQTTADLISQLAAIFRGFISSKTFIPLCEELTLCKRYLALFGARYENKIDIRYDFDKEILQYGIIRNLFQPLIENYFVHGFDTSNSDNYILFMGKSLNDETILLTVEDNGSGMTEEDLEQLNARLNEPIQIETESYGLKNLHQRLQLFYGADYGLKIFSNSNTHKGISIQMTVRKLTCDMYEQSQQKGRQKNTSEKIS